MRLKRNKFFIIAVLALIACIFLEMQDFVYSSDIQSGYIASKHPELWGNIIADSVNQKTIYLTVDGNKVDLLREKPYMDKDLNLMLPISVVKEYFNCGSYIMDNNIFVMEQGEKVIKMKLGDRNMDINGTKETISVPFTQKGKEYYISAEVLEKALGCQYTWDVTTNNATFFNVGGEAQKLPYQYDYRKVMRKPSTKDQGKWGTCWAFASLTALESSLLPEERLDFSEDHMTFKNSFSSSRNDGGTYNMAMAYLTSWQGPVLEKDDPYGDGVSPDGLKAVKHVQEIQIIKEKDFDKIKEMVLKYGGVQSSLYTLLNGADTQSEYYNEKTNAYCYIGTEKANHDVVIIGWDDNYPKENFNVNLEADGAFICQNSWGKDFGEDGIFYVSYYDTNIGIHNVVYTKVEDIDNYENIYQSDLCGWSGQVGYGKNTAYFANVYQTKGKESLQAVGFYATDKDTEYEIFLVSDFKDTISLLNRKELKKGKLENAGYYTIPLEEQVLEKGKKFAIVVKITTPNAKKPIAIEYAADNATKDVDLSDGEGYISQHGTEWERAEITQSCNICLKAYTKKLE